MIEDGVLWEEKTASFPYRPDVWIDKHITTKFERYLEARQFIDGYTDAPIGFRFDGSPNDPVFIEKVLAEIERLRIAHPDVDIRIEAFPE